ncbi:uncharacterized protein N7496_010525 [Penicillium cataractarum]|uniref:Cyanovirin-N domain-containing protein n=1 Tax=Penicillium cataractarum TaxID=2100454 RepID=A0A9W9V0Z1_9EURO|nr:uncharacterized protein N7496_010525 [Penicillium cataractarum]KAJ5364812.1 hypothetical protein N7496_010525 [Penicillium cataractarum]
MAFNKTACDIHLSLHDGGTHLIAICNNDEGSGITGDLLLDQCLGSKDGHFVWGGTNFSKNAKNVTFSTEGPDRKPILHSELLDSSGHYVQDKVDLASHIANVEGELKYTEPED